MSAVFSSYVPCDMLMRTPSAPAASMASNVCGSREAGPIVASILARLTMQSILNQQWNHGTNFSRVQIKLTSKHLAQEALFAAYANKGTYGKHDYRQHKSNPVTNRQSGRQQHPKHSRVNRITHETIRPLCYQLVSFDHARCQAPLLPKRSNRGSTEPDRCRRQDHRQN